MSKSKNLKRHSQKITHRHIRKRKKQEQEKPRLDNHEPWMYGFSYKMEQSKMTLCRERDLSNKYLKLIY